MFLPFLTPVFSWLVAGGLASVINSEEKLAILPCFCQTPAAIALFLLTQVVVFFTSGRTRKGRPLKAPRSQILITCIGLFVLCTVHSLAYTAAKTTLQPTSSPRLRATVARYFWSRYVIGNSSGQKPNDLLSSPISPKKILGNPETGIRSAVHLMHPYSDITLEIYIISRKYQ